MNEANCRSIGQQCPALMLHAIKRSFSSLASYFLPVVDPPGSFGRQQSAARLSTDIYSAKSHM